VSTKWLTDWLVYLLVRTFIALVQAMRMETCAAIANVLAWVADDVVGLRRKVIDANLRRAFPQLSSDQRRALSRRVWQHLFVMICEIAHAPRKIHRTNWHRYVTIEDRRRLLQYLLDPRPTVLVSGHYGNFELGGFITGLLGFPTFTVARTLDNPHLDAFVNRFRSSHGQFILPKQGSATHIAAVLDAGGALTLLGDQHAGQKACWVDFFGQPASCHKAISLFTLTTGAPMLVVYARRHGRPLHFDVGVAGVADPAVDDGTLATVPALTQWYNHRLEDVIRQTPDQYWWVHRRWKGEPPKRYRKQRRTAA
jgi:KDO2-lipid IV(A) lauroyltransferase